MLDQEPTVARQEDSSDGPDRAQKVKSGLVNLGQLPTLPEAATRALLVANDRRSTLKDFANVVEQDPVLAAGILRLANSALFGVGREVTSLDQAVVRLGLRRCKSLLLTVGVRTLFHAGGAAQRYCKRLWGHSLLTACLCRRLNLSLEAGYDGDEFPCGLCHDLGHLLIALAAPWFLEAPSGTNQAPGLDQVGREQELLGCDHCSLGAWYAERNHLPGGVIHAIKYHHAPGSAPSHPMLVGLVATADQMANYADSGAGLEDYSLSDNTGWSFLSRSFDEGMRGKVEGLAPAMLAEAVAEAREAESPRAA